MATKKLGSAARFGPRYGKRLKAKITSIEKIQKQRQVCPYCGRKAVKRVSTGIWLCNKCNSKFASKAYRIGA